MTFFEYVINNTLNKKTHTIFFVFGRSGTGKTYSTIAFAHLLNNLYRKKRGLETIPIEEFINKCYFSSISSFKNFLTVVLERRNIINEFVIIFDEIKEFVDYFQQNIYNIFNRIRIFTKEKALITFMIGHSYADIEEVKLRRIVRYFVKFISLGTFKIYETYEKPVGFKYMQYYRRARFIDTDGLRSLVDKVYIDLSGETIRKIRSEIEALEVIVKEMTIRKEIDEMYPEYKKEKINKINYE
ncbi:MAG: ATP-binding protein [Nanopusillaceae archaeon]